MFMIYDRLEDSLKGRARYFLERLIMQVASKITGKGIQPTTYVDTVYRPGLDELNVEKTLENLVGTEVPSLDDFICRERVEKKKAVVLILDVSSSMQREKLVLALLTIGVLSKKMGENPYAIVTFRDEADVLKPMKQYNSSQQLVDKFLNINFGGATNISEALQVGLSELNGIQVGRRYGILVTDGWVTKGRNPLDFAKQYPKLHVIRVPMGVGGGDPTTCSLIAKEGNGKYFRIKDYEDLPRALLQLLKES